MKLPHEIPDAALLDEVARITGPIERIEPLGASTAFTSRVFLRSGERRVLKHHRGLASESFGFEARQLAWLGKAREAGAAQVIQVFGSGPGWLLLEEAQPRPTDDGAWERLGEDLARQHAFAGDFFGWEHDCYWGPHRWPAQQMKDGFEFYGLWRLTLAANLTGVREAIGDENHKRVLNIAGRLREFFPEQPAVLLHGDLWMNNVLGSATGECLLIDPSVHFGWPEWDLAMTTLWSAGFPAAFWDAYRHHRPLAPGWEDRLALLTLAPHLASVAEGYMQGMEHAVRLLGRFG